MINKDILRKYVSGQSVNQAYISNLVSNLKSDVKTFLSCLYNTSIDNYTYFRRVLLNNEDFSSILTDYECISLLEKFYNANFSNIEQFIEYLIIIYNINQYNIKNLSNRLDRVYRKESGRILKNNILDPDKYEKFDLLMNNRYINTDDMYLVGFNNGPEITELKLQEIYAEYVVYKQLFKNHGTAALRFDQLNQIHSRKNIHFYPYRWLSHFDGDGYGADLLFNIPGLGKEELHEVKKRLLDREGNLKERTALTPNERDISIETSTNDHADYYIDIVRMQYEVPKIYNYEIVQYKLNKNTGEFFNVKDPREEVYIEKQNGKYLLFDKRDRNRII